MAKINFSEYVFIRSVSSSSDLFNILLRYLSDREREHRGGGGGGGGGGEQASTTGKPDQILFPSERMTIPVA